MFRPLHKPFSDTEIPNGKINEEPFIVGISMVKNEEDVIEQFVRHNLHYLSLLCVMDNGSMDNTRPILEDLQKDGLPLIIIDDPDPSFDQDGKMTGLLNNMQITLYPDFIIPLDADEFIKCESKETFLKDLMTIPRKGKGFAKWQTYIVPKNTEGEVSADPLSYMNERRKVEKPQYKKVVLRLDRELVPHVCITFGNHNAEGLDKGVDLENVHLAHFPVRSKKQIMEKILLGCMAMFLRFPGIRYTKQGYQWLEIFDRIKEDSDFEDESLRRYSINYAQHENDDWAENVIEDPMFFHYGPLLYSTEDRASSLSKVARTIENNFAAKRDRFVEDLVGLIHKKKSDFANMSGRKNGIRYAASHDEKYLHMYSLDIPPVKFLYDRFRPESVLDAGCGMGHYLAYFKHRGAERIAGIDGISPGVSLLEPGQYIQQDLNKGVDIQGKYDLILCMETVEHIDEDASLKLIGKLSEHAGRLILFSAAEPHQAGIGHVNCKPIKYWIKKWDKLGWEPILFDTLAFRVLATFSWMKRNTLVLKRKDSRHRASVDRLKVIGNKEFRWWKQKGGVITTPLMAYTDKEYEGSPEKDPPGIEAPSQVQKKDVSASQSWQAGDTDSYKNMDFQDALIRINEVESELENAKQELSSIKKSKTWLLVKILWKITGYLRIG
ncbi:MAG: glycosyltransferase family 2 protein [bacterium]